MAKINLEKFICDTIRIGRKWHEQDEDNESLDKMASLFELVLENQGLEYKDRQLVKINTSATENEIPHEKFKDDAWVVCEHNNIIGKPIQYKELKSQAYKTFLSNLKLIGIKPNIRLWTIQDAKDGDVLYSEHGDSTFIFKCIDHGRIRLYCDVSLYERWEKLTNEAFRICNDDNSYGMVEEADDIHPATQEQRNLLFEMMTEVGYRWDAEKKELKKIQMSDLVNTNGTNTIKFEESKEKMTEFEKQFQAYMYHPNTDLDVIHACCQKLLSVARKQIIELKQSELDEMIYRFKNSNMNFLDKRVADIYRQGILDTLEKIKEK